MDEILQTLQRRHAALMRRRHRNAQAIKNAKDDDLAVDRELADVTAAARVMGVSMEDVQSDEPA